MREGVRVCGSADAAVSANDTSSRCSTWTDVFKRTRYPAAA